MDTVVAVKFKHSHVYRGKEYYYRTNLYLSVGEEVIVNISKDHMDLQIALVTNVNVSGISSSNLDQIVQKVDTSNYLDKRYLVDKINSLKKELDRSVQTYQEEHMYESIAKIDDSFREIYLDYIQKLESYQRDSSISYGL